LRWLLGPTSARGRSIIAGVISVILVTGAAYVGVSAANGAFDPTYDVVGIFDSAGQGLLPESDVKIHGVNIGEVAAVDLEGGRAKVTMKIDKAERIPTSSTATIRPKTLFGEKFVDIDPGDAETTGPFLRDGGRIEDTVGGFELERILGDLYPVLQAVDGDQLAVILGELAAAGRGMGETVNRSIANFTLVADVQARHARDTQQFLDDLALLSEELALRSDDLVAGARDLNVALPPLNARSEQLATVLDQSARLSADLADVLEANRPFLDKSITKGGKALTVLEARKAQIPGLVRGLRYFVQVLSEVGRIELGDGTRLAAVKGIIGGGSECGRTTAGCPTYDGGVAGRSANGRAGTGTGASANRDGQSGQSDQGVEPLPLPLPQGGAEGLVSLVGGTLR